MKFLIGSVATFVLLSLILWLIENYTSARGDWWTWAQICLASLIVGYIYSMDEKL